VTETRADTATDAVALEAAPRRVKMWKQFRTGLVRSSDERVLSGLAAGVAARLRIRNPYVRAAFVVLTLAGGLGILLYGIGWALATTSSPTRNVPRDLARRQQLGLALFLLSALFAARGLGLWFGDALVWSSLWIAFGIAAIWDRSDRNAEGSRSVLAETAPRGVRVVVGAVLMLVGVATFASSVDAMRQLGPIVIPVGITAAGFMLVFGPWVVRLAGDLTAERRDRIRSEERSEMAAHLHDSVLQTLALIQRSDDPRKMVTLARSQERDLRHWLYNAEQADGADTLSRALEAAASRTEQAHDVPIEVVVVNDVPMTDHVNAVVKAASEAMNNAARHSGAGRVSVYAEAVGGSLDVFISDQGKGFDAADVPEDRHGIRESIARRMTRHGGTSEIHSEPGEGTEVHLELPLEES
jgi:signal transduction histidine kinase